MRRRSADAVMDEVRALSDRYGTRRIVFMDDCWSLDRRRAVELCERLGEAGPSWTCLARPEGLDAELLALMREAGCVSVALGVESGSDRVLRRVLVKRTTVAATLEAARAVKEAGIGLTAYFMVGLPGETSAEIEATRRLMDEMAPDAAFVSPFIPYLGTPLGDRVLAEGLLTLRDYEEHGYAPMTLGHRLVAPEAREGFREQLEELLAEVTFANDARARLRQLRDLAAERSS